MDDCDVSQHCAASGKHNSCTIVYAYIFIHSSPAQKRAAIGPYLWRLLGPHRILFWNEDKLSVAPWINGARALAVNKNNLQNDQCKYIDKGLMNTANI